jgi:hypothetical protein
MDDEVSFLFYLVHCSSSSSQSAQIVSVGNFNLPTSRDLHDQLLHFAYASRDLPLATNLLPIQIYLRQ